MINKGIHTPKCNVAKHEKYSLDFDGGKREWDKRRGGMTFMNRNKLIKQHGSPALKATHVDQLEKALDAIKEVAIRRKRWGVGAISDSDCLEEIDAILGRF